MLASSFKSVQCLGITQRPAYNVRTDTLLPLSCSIVTAKITLLLTSSCDTFRQFGSCRSHKEEQRFWCKECKSALCSLCLYSDHQQGHEVIPAKQVMEEKKNFLHHQMERLNGEVMHGRSEIEYIYEYMLTRMKQVGISATVEGVIKASEDLFSLMTSYLSYKSDYRSIAKGYCKEWQLQCMISKFFEHV